MNSLAAFKRRQTKAPRKRELLFIAISYSAGVLLCFMLGIGSDVLAYDKLAMVSGAFIPVVALSLLLALQLSAFSVLGGFYIPFIALLEGFIALLYPGSIISGEWEPEVIIKLLFLLFVFIALTLIIACSSFRSALSVAGKLAPDKRLKPQFLKLAIILTAFLSSLVFGLTDSNIF